MRILATETNTLSHTNTIPLQTTTADSEQKTMFRKEAIALVEGTPCMAPDAIIKFRLFHLLGRSLTTTTYLKLVHHYARQLIIALAGSPGDQLSCFITKATHKDINLDRRVNVAHSTAIDEISYFNADQ